MKKLLVVAILICAAALTGCSRGMVRGLGTALMVTAAVADIAATAAHHDRCRRHRHRRCCQRCYSVYVPDDCVCCR